ncbi:prkc apoptosis wt1 regulator [Lasius niger]|uniref:Prkc apoptosis wt1 regulator n=1 Tax=Lasius niger TaxID=67767 RepID=A0A0J7P4G4_LASNI|nr:prkc apoptosis wt1 regulator [Lasius niger]
MGNSKSKNEHNSHSTGSAIILDKNEKIHRNVSASSAIDPNINPNINYVIIPNKPHINNEFPKSCNDHKSHPNSERRTQDLFHKFDKPHNLAFNDTVNVQPKFMTETCVNKEKCNNENQTIDLKNKSVIAPPKISTKDDFMTKWFSWKNEFLTYMKSIDPEETKKQNWGIMLLNRMGPIGQEIHRGFTFDKDHTEGNIDILLKQFDFYCIYGGRRRGNDEDIDKYVNDLTVMASKYMTNTHEVVKEKILMEIDKESTPDVEESQGAYDASSNPMLLSEHDNLQSKPMMRKQDKRVTGRHSDLEADDEEFDSLNQSDSINQSDHGNHEPQTSVNATGRPRLPTPTGDNPHELIERAQEENRRLLSLLEDRDHKIMALEARILKQQHEMAVERERLREENATLIRAMAALASN